MFMRKLSVGKSWKVKSSIHRMNLMYPSNIQSICSIKILLDSCRVNYVNMEEAKEGFYWLGVFG